GPSLGDQVGRAARRVRLEELHRATRHARVVRRADLALEGARGGRVQGDGAPRLLGTRRPRDAAGEQQHARGRYRDQGRETAHPGTGTSAEKPALQTNLPTARLFAFTCTNFGPVGRLFGMVPWSFQLPFESLVEPSSTARTVPLASVT